MKSEILCDNPKIEIVNADCLSVMKQLPDCCIDAVVTDPPYELGFMGKSWDNTGITYKIELWREVLRVLKPGGHLLSFGGSRTYHRMACAIEDAGFEIRDMIEYVYGSGFPKSLNIGKAVDKINGESGRLLKFVEWYRTTGMKQKETNEIIGKTDVGSHYLRLDQPAIPTVKLWEILRPHIKIEIPKWVDELVERIEREREVVGRGKAGLTAGTIANFAGEKEFDLTKGTSEWEGWGTALKPAHEPICMARKPLSEKTIVENCLKWGVGGINIDGSRVDFVSEQDEKSQDRPNVLGKKYGGKNEGAFLNDFVKKYGCNKMHHEQGRFPANFIHDGSQGVLELFPNTGKSQGGGKKKGVKYGEIYGYTSKVDVGNEGYYGDSGSAARFFYCAKASKAERNRGCEGLEEKQTTGGGGGIGDYKDDVNSMSGKYGSEKAPAHNNHPTVKPISLMKYLVKLITREAQTVLDPFMGSGTTGLACKELGRNFIGIEISKDYYEIAKKRIQNTQRSMF